MNNDTLAIRKRKLAWHARRGLLELDCIIQPYMRNLFVDIDNDEVALLETLFNMEDPDLLKCLMQPEQARLLPLPQQNMINKILSATH